MTHVFALCQVLLEEVVRVVEALALLHLNLHVGNYIISNVVFHLAVDFQGLDRLSLLFDELDAHVVNFNFKVLNILKLHIDLWFFEGAVLVEVNSKDAHDQDSFVFEKKAPFSLDSVPVNGAGVTWAIQKIL